MIRFRFRISGQPANISVVMEITTTGNTLHECMQLAQDYILKFYSWELIECIGSEVLR